MKRSGFADLPLHGGRVPQWLAERMTKLGTAIAESVIYHYGSSEFLSRLSDPFWFQAFGSVMGMDWHSSGITTSVLGALKRGLNSRSHELGLYVCGGRGRHSRKTPDELRTIADRIGLRGDTLVRSSRLTARIDNNAVADGFQLYLHSFVLSSTGEWAVVQQGMNDTTGLARRYHWHSAAVRDFVSDPHTAIVGEHQGTIMNLVDHQAKPAQNALLTIAHEHPDSTITEIQRLAGSGASAEISSSGPEPRSSVVKGPAFPARHYTAPRHHDLRAENIDLKRLGAVLALAYERDLRDFASLLLLENLGPRTLQSLALIAEVVHGTPTRFSDPARFSFALGGKDRHPFPVPLKTYDESLSVLRRSLDAAKLGDPDKLDGFKRLDRFTRVIEQRLSPVADFNAALAHERAISPSLDGRSVFDDLPVRKRQKQENPKRYSSDPQLDLFKK